MKVLNIDIKAAAEKQFFWYHGLATRLSFDMDIFGVPHLLYDYILPLAVLLFAICYYLKLGYRRHYPLSTSGVQASTPQDVESCYAASKSTDLYRNLFFQLQNPEDHPAVLEPAREELLSMFSLGLSHGVEVPRGSILSIEHYEAKKLWNFLEEQNAVLTMWRDYLARRKQGQGPELFATTGAAKTWLVQQAPVKFVDGAWLGHIHKITSPFALRSITKDAWQILSEELGDGDLSKHHVYLYHQLLQDIGCPLSDSHSADFIQPCHWDTMNNYDAWKAAVGQLLISLFPNKFLPEILGFNMHYELITLDTLRAAHELKALDVNPYYFLIHIAIDNADSGHTAMAIHTVTRYLDTVRATEGEVALEQAWKRVQIGYTLSQALGSSHSREAECSGGAVALPGSVALSTPLDPLSAGVIDIFRAKASVSKQFHCQSRVRIGGQTLAEWLDPSMWRHSNSRQHLKLLTALSQTRPWIYPGASGKSMLVRELLWGGRMFGAFTHDEVVTLSAWIDSLNPENKSRLYWSFSGRNQSASKKVVRELQDPVRHHPVVIPCAAEDNKDTEIFSTESLEFDLEPDFPNEETLPPSSKFRSSLMALWFAHVDLLENAITTPSRTASPLYASILRLLRAQAGFAIETHIVAGMDEMKRISCPSLVDIGLELMSRAGWTTSANPSCLQDVFLLAKNQGQGEKSARLSHDMLWWGLQPSAKLGWLLGMAFAFLELKVAVMRAPELPSQESQFTLATIVGRERQCLMECAQELLL